MGNLIVKNLVFSYNKNVILDNLSFSLEKGEFVAVLGKSGAGKSTLLRCLNKLNVADSGKIFINGDDILSLNKNKLRFVRQKIAFIFQDYNILDNLYTLDNVLTSFLAKKNFLLAMANIYSKEEYELAIKYLTLVGLEKEIYKKSKYLSGGQKQRVAIAKAICQKPEVLLADEPISSLDKNNSEAIMTLFKTLNKKKNITVLMNLHDINVAKKYCDKILGLKDGKILFFKKTESVTEDELNELYK